MKKLISVIGGLVLFLFVLFLVIAFISNSFEKQSKLIEEKYNSSSGSIDLLAVSVNENESSNGYGSLAGLDLKVSENNLNEERVFIETEPIVKLDTQISTKFAKDIACDYIVNKKIELILMGEDGLWSSSCDGKDFVYSFDSDAYYLAGPSASSVVAVLTISIVEGIPIRDDVAMTGTLQTGGYIGAVSGIKEKVEVAKRYGMKKVLISSGTENLTGLVDYGKSIGVEVVAVENLDDAMKEFVDDSQYSNFYDSIEQLSQNVSVENSFYSEMMDNIAYDMMFESKNKFDSIDVYCKKYENYCSIQKNSLNEIENEYENENYYSSASYSFVGLVNIGTFEILSSKFPEIMNLVDNSLDNQTSRFIFSVEVVGKEVDEGYVDEIEKLIDEKTKEYSNKYEKEKEKYSYPDELTSVEFEIYGTIVERLDNVKSDLERLEEKNFTGDSNEIVNEIIDSAYLISRIEQRFYTIEQWSKFLEKEYSGVSLTKNDLKSLCDLKVNEAIEYINFVDMFYGVGLESRNEIVEHQNNKEYLECVFKATLAKADMEYFLEEIYNLNDSLIIEKRLDSIENDILISNLFDEYLIENYEFDESFPIVAYNYYEYSKVLKKSDGGLALIYFEYAIELNKLHNEFNRILIGKISGANGVPVNLENFDNIFLVKLYVLIGMFISLIIGIIIGFSIKKTTKRGKISIKK